MELGRLPQGVLEWRMNQQIRGVKKDAEKSKGRISGEDKKRERRSD
jgi:hypothetical protein